jgi:hypothetical protein
MTALPGMVLRRASLVLAKVVASYSVATAPRATGALQRLAQV